MGSERRVCRVWALAGLGFLLGIAAPAVAAAQNKLDVRLGAGLTATDALRAWEPHALVEVGVSARPWLAVRGAGFLTFGRQFSADRALTEGLDLNAVVVSHGTPVRPYFGAGLGYAHTRLSSAMPLRHDVGVGAVLGLQLAGDSGWYVEARMRYFGNVFYKWASTKSLHLVTIGRRW